MSTTKTEVTEQEDMPMNSAEEAVMQQLDAMKKVRDFYYEPRNPDELDLITEIRQAMLEAGVSKEALEHVYDKHPLLVESVNKHAAVQQHNLSRFFNEQLMCHQGLETISGNKIDTRLDRYQLLNEVTPSEYLKIVSVSVIPKMAALNLPKDFFYDQESTSSGSTAPETT